MARTAHLRVIAKKSAKSKTDLERTVAFLRAEEGAEISKVSKFWFNCLAVELPALILCRRLHLELAATFGEYMTDLPAGWLQKMTFFVQADREWNQEKEDNCSNT